MRKGTNMAEGKGQDEEGREEGKGRDRWKMRGRKRWNEESGDVLGLGRGYALLDMLNKCTKVYYHICRYASIKWVLSYQPYESLPAEHVRAPGLFGRWSYFVELHQIVSVTQH